MVACVACFACSWLVHNPTFFDGQNMSACTKTTKQTNPSSPMEPMPHPQAFGVLSSLSPQLGLPMNEAFYCNFFSPLFVFFFLLFVVDLQYAMQRNFLSFKAKFIHYSLLVSFLNKRLLQRCLIKRTKIKVFEKKLKL